MLLIIDNDYSINFIRIVTYIMMQYHSSLLISKKNLNTLWLNWNFLQQFIYSVDSIYGLGSSVTYTFCLLSFHVSERKNKAPFYLSIKHNKSCNMIEKDICLGRNTRTILFDYTFCFCDNNNTRWRSIMMKMSSSNNNPKENWEDKQYKVWKLKPISSSKVFFCF